MISLRLKARKKRVNVRRAVPLLPHGPNEQWSIDFMSDSLYDGRRFRVLRLVDNMSRETPALVADSLLWRSGSRDAPRLEATWGLPKSIQIDNGPEFCSKALDDWGHRHRIKLVFK